MGLIHGDAHRDGRTSADRGADLAIGILEYGYDRLQERQIIFEIMIVDDDVPIIPHQLGQCASDALYVGIVPSPFAVGDARLDDPRLGAVVVGLEITAEDLRTVLLRLHRHSFPNALSYCSIRNRASLSLASPMT